MIMYDRVRLMNQSEMKEFIYWVYVCGTMDGRENLQDSPGDSSYFGGHMLMLPAREVMPHDSIQDLWDDFKNIYG